MTQLQKRSSRNPMINIDKCWVAANITNKYNIMSQNYSSYESCSWWSGNSNMPKLKNKKHPKYLCLKWIYWLSGVDYIVTSHLQSTKLLKDKSLKVWSR